jgi:hypothetical protein
MTYESTRPAEDEERSWLLTQMGRLRSASGNTDAAEKLLQQALTALPNYPFRCLRVGAARQRLWPLAFATQSFFATPARWL